MDMKEATRVRRAEPVTAEEVRRIFRYDAGDACLRWATPPDARWMVDERCGTTDNKGYRRIGIRGRYFREHRLVWLYHKGEWPTVDIDHINGDKTDNRIENLREAKSGENRANSRKNKNRRYDLPKGVQPRPYGFIAQITVGGRVLYLGHFKTPEEAHAVYCEAARKYHGEFFHPGD